MTGNVIKSGNLQITINSKATYKIEVVTIYPGYVMNYENPDLYPSSENGDVNIKDSSGNTITIKNNYRISIFSQEIGGCTFDVTLKALN